MSQVATDDVRERQLEARVPDRRLGRLSAVHHSQDRLLSVLHSCSFNVCRCQALSGPGEAAIPPEQAFAQGTDPIGRNHMTDPPPPPPPPVTPPRAAPAEPIPLARQAWEYKTKWVREGLSKGTMGGGTLERELDKLGRDGWELVALVNDRAIFKRPR